MSSRISAFVVALGALLVSGMMYHLLATDSSQLDGAAARIAHVPLVIGPWHGRDEKVEEAAFEQAGAQGYWMRTYVHQESKASVLAILMCGRAGRMAVHTPEVCYRGAGFELSGEATPVALDGNQFWSAQFSKKRAGQTTTLRLFWAWNSRGEWEAPTSPRWHFRGEPFLYKLYVSHELATASNSTPALDATADFLKQLTPQLKATLFP